MRFAVLGSLAVEDESGPIPIVGAMPRALLGLLLLNANQVISTDRLTDVLWEGQLRASAPAALRNHVMRLRKFLGDSTAERIRTAGRGYAVRIEPGELDLHTFAELRARGTAAAKEERWEQAAADLRTALALYRGAPLADVPLLAGAEPALRQVEEARLQTVEDRIEADLRLGRHHAAVVDLLALTGGHPLHEGFHRQLMLALYQSGRPAEALDVFLALRRTLVDELGVEPSGPTRELHSRILNGDPELSVPRTAARPTADQSPPAPAPGTTAVPAQLPMDIGDFAGRDEVVADLCRLLGTGSGDGPARPVVLSAVTGIGGVGKTTLAVHVAHKVLADYPDGQMYVSLRGSGDSPRDPAEVLAELLRDLGEPESAVPPDVEGRATRYRSLTSRRRLLVILDDARDAAQVRPLLPCSGACAVLVTSRRRLPGLAGAALRNLDVLEPSEALELFTSVVGAVRVLAEPEAVQEVLDYCGGLPLALRIAAARLASRPTWTVATLAARLADEHRRLDELRVDDIAVRASFQMSYSALADSQNSQNPQNFQKSQGQAAISAHRAFRLLGLVPGPDFTAHAAAALFDQPLGVAEDLLEGLLDLNLLQDASPGRYRFHDLISLYAHECAVLDEEPADREAALERLLLWYAHRADASTAAISPTAHRIELAPSPYRFPFDSHDHAVLWCRAELPNIVACVQQARRSGHATLAWQTAAAMWTYFRLASAWDAWLLCYRTGLAAAQEAGDLVGESDMHVGLGVLCARLEDLDESLRHSGEALRLYRDRGLITGQAAALNNIADAQMRRGEYEEALVSLTRARDLHEGMGLGDSVTTFTTVLTIGQTLGRLGRHDEAIEILEQAKTIVDQAGDRYLAASAYAFLGQVHLQAGDPARAEAALTQAVGLREAIGYRLGVGLALLDLGDVHRHAGRPAAARQSWQRALTIFDELNHRARAADAEERLRSLGEFELADRLAARPEASDEQLVGGFEASAGDAVVSGQPGSR